MEKERKNKKYKIGKIRMGFKFMKMFFFRVIKRRWYLPSISEITVDELFDRINSNVPPLILDHRPAKEFYGNGENSYMTVYGHIQNSLNMGIMELSSNLEDLQSFMELTTDLEDLQAFKEKEFVTICPGGGMSLVAAEIMGHAGFTDAKSLKKGLYGWYKKEYPLVTTPDHTIKSSDFEDKATAMDGKMSLDDASMTEVHKTVDARGLLCPKPILKSRKALKDMEVNQVLEILTTDPGSKIDIPSWALATGNELLISEERGPKEFRFLVKRKK